MQQIGLRADATTYTTLISACRHTIDWRQSYALYQRMRAGGVAPDRRVFTTLIAACARDGAWAQALAFLKQALAFLK
eukprot:4970054-Pyramimonas_sp.AAC.1